MAGRFQELYRLPSKLYAEGSPVIIDAGALQKDTQTGKILAQIKIQNVSPNIIIGCKVNVHAYELNGSELDGVDSFSYLDISVARGGYFGAKVPVFFPDDLTRKFSVTVTEVLFNDNSMWQNNSAEWRAIPKQNKVESVLQNSALVEEYKLEMGSSAEFYPEITNDLFLCTCGTINIGANSPCYKCRRKYDTLIQALNPEKLEKQIAERLEKEQQKKEEEERRLAQIAAEKKEKAQQRKKKFIKISKIVVPIILIAAVIAFVTPRYIQPAIKKAMSYKEAIEYLNQGQYDDAITAFSLLEDYKDSKQQLKEAKYRKADNFYQAGNYEDAINIWRTIAKYSDSENRITMAKDAITEGIYQNAMDLYNNQDYIKAAKVFDDLDGYKDSKDKVEECWKNMIDYISQVDYNALSDDEYDQCMTYFKTIGDNDALTVAYYKYGKKLSDTGDYDNAAYYFNKVPGYEDADTLFLDNTYKAACNVLEKGNYSRAITLFQKCPDYQDTTEKLLYAEFQYVKEHKYNPDLDTERYLYDLIQNGYSGAQDLHDEVFRWKITVTAINDSKSGTSDMSSISRSETIYFHVKLTGGASTDSTYLKCKSKWPDGSTMTSKSTEKWRSGDSGTWSFYYHNSQYGTTGTLTAWFYDDKGNEIGNGSVQITY